MIDDRTFVTTIPSGIPIPPALPHILAHYAISSHSISAILGKPLSEGDRSPSERGRDVSGHGAGPKVLDVPVGAMMPCPQCGTSLERRLEDLLPRIHKARSGTPAPNRPSKPRPQVLSDHPRCACGLFRVRSEVTGWVWMFGTAQCRFFLRTGRPVRTHEPRWDALNKPGAVLSLSEAMIERTPAGVQEAIDRVVCSLILLS